MGIATSLATQLDRLVDSILEDVASDGLALLKRILDSAGFAKSPFLKDCQVLAHVVRGSVLFEILLDVESLVPADEITRKAVEDAATAAVAAQEEASASFAMGPHGPQRLVSRQNALRDARRPAGDARRPARDARKGSLDRLVEKEVANFAPRSAKVNREGRLSVALRRSATASGEGIVMPQGEFQGIIGNFVSELRKVIASQFSSGLEDIIARRSS